MKGKPKAPTGRLMGMTELAKKFGVSVHRAQQIAAKTSFPAPYDELAMGRVWNIKDVEAWAKIYREEQP